MKNKYTYKVDEKFFYFSSPFNMELISDIKEITTSQFNPVTKEWSIEIRDFNEAQIVDLVDKWGFEPYEAEPIKVEQKLEYTPIDYAHIEGKLSMLDLKFQPRDYQKQTIAYGLDKKRFINGLDMGLGKTFCAMLTTELERAFPCLVITPASVKYKFAEQWTELVGRKSVAVIDSKETKKRKNDWDADVVVINYDILGKLIDSKRISKKTGKPLKDLVYKFDQLKSKKWKSVILDEAHFVKSSKAARSQAAKGIVRGVENIQMLTGTAIGNKPKELINLLNILGTFEKISPSWNSFIYEFCNARQTSHGLNYDGASNTLELNQRMRNETYIRFEKNDVLTELPPVQKSVIDVNIQNKKEYNKAEYDSFGYLWENESEEAAFDSLNAEHLVKLNILRQLSAKGKVKYLKQYLKDWQEGCDEKLLVFGLHKEVLEELSTQFKCDLIAGGVSSKRKFEMVKDFTNGENQFLFANMKAAGTGTDGLQDNCSNMLIYELPWSPDLLEQSIARLDRSGQKHSTNVTFVLDNTTIDQDMWELLEKKEKIADAVNKGIDVDYEGVGMKSIMKKFKNKEK